jgi:hypothetical protein
MRRTVFCRVKIGAVLSVSVVVLAAATFVAAQGRPNRPMPPPEGAPGVSPAEIQGLFEAYVVMQAQRELQLTDEQYPKFLSRVRVLQEARRRGQNERMRHLQELRRLTQTTASGDDLPLRTQLRALDELEARVAGEVRQAMADLDQVLDVRQQARFRLLEEAMERRKLELLAQVRQRNRPRNQF